jgi:hypothetical protein
VALSLIPLAILARVQWTARLLILPLHRVFPKQIPIFEIFASLQTIVLQAVLPTGLFLIGVFFLISATCKLLKFRKSVAALQECALGAYAVLAGVRQMMGVASYSAVFFNVPLFILLVIVLSRIVRRAGSKLAEAQRKLFASALLLGEAGLVLLIFFPNPQLLPARLTTNIGAFYTRSDVAVLFPQIINFMKTHTKNGKDILVAPDPPSLYTFAGMQAPSHWYSLMPGVIAPEQEARFIQEATANQVSFVLIAEETLNEYGGVRFGNGYNEAIYRWITANYEKVGQFGPLSGAPSSPYLVSVYQRKGPSSRDASGVQ